MLPNTDPSAFQSWMIAIPSAITAVSTWYLNRKTVKTGEKTNSNTEQLISDHAENMASEIKTLKDRIALIEESIQKTRESQLDIAKRHTETMTQVSLEIQSAKDLFQKVMLARGASASGPMKAPGSTQQNGSLNSVDLTVKEPLPATNGRVTIIESPPPPNGKIILKP